MENGDLIQSPFCLFVACGIVKEDGKPFRDSLKEVDMVLGEVVRSLAAEVEGADDPSLINERKEERRLHSSLKELPVNPRIAF